jgi:hypothetical protein
VEAAHRVAQAGFAGLAHQLDNAGVLAFMHSLVGGCLVAAGVALVGAIVAATWLPARPQVEAEEPVAVPGLERDLEAVTAGSSDQRSPAS